MEVDTTVVLGAIGFVLSYLARTYLLSKIKNQQVREILSSLGEIAKTAVLATAQTYVDAIRGKEGSLTADQKKEARDKAISVAKKKLGEAGAKALQEFLGKSSTIEDVLADEIEAQVKMSKTKKTQMAPAPTDSAKLSAPPDISSNADHDPSASPAGEAPEGASPDPTKNV